MTSSDEQPVKDTSEGNGNIFLRILNGLLWVFLALLSFSPLTAFSDDVRSSSIISLCLNISSFLVTLILYKLGIKQFWPRYLDIMLFPLTLIRLIVVLADPDTEVFSDEAGNAYNFLGVSFLMGIFWLSGRPLTYPYEVDSYGLVGATHPIRKFKTIVDSGSFLVLFFLAGIFNLPAAINGNESDSLSSAQIIPLALILPAEILSPLFVHFFEAKLVERYNSQIVDWNAEHPDEELVKRFEVASGANNA